MLQITFLVPYSLVCGDLGARAAHFCRGGDWCNASVTLLGQPGPTACAPAWQLGRAADPGEGVPGEGADGREHSRAHCFGTDRGHDPEATFSTCAAHEDAEEVEPAAQRGREELQPRKELKEKNRDKKHQWPHFVAILRRHTYLRTNGSGELS